MFKALKSFTGKVKMQKGQVADIKDKDIIEDLLNAGYIEEVKEEAKKETTKLKNEIKNDVEKVVFKVEEEVKKITSKKPKIK